MRDEIVLVNDKYLISIYYSNKREIYDISFLLYDSVDYHVIPPEKAGISAEYLFSSDFCSYSPVIHTFYVKTEEDVDKFLDYVDKFEEYKAFL